MSLYFTSTGLSFCAFSPRHSHCSNKTGIMPLLINDVYSSEKADNNFLSHTDQYFLPSRQPFFGGGTGPVKTFALTKAKYVSDQPRLPR